MFIMLSLYFLTNPVPDTVCNECLWPVAGLVVQHSLTTCCTDHELVARPSNRCAKVHGLDPSGHLQTSVVVLIKDMARPHVHVAPVRRVHPPRPAHGNNELAR